MNLSIDPNTNHWRLRKGLEERLGSECFHRWFGSDESPRVTLQWTRASDSQGIAGTLTVLANTQFAMDMVRRQFRGELLDVVRTLVHGTPHLEFAVLSQESPLEPAFSSELQNSQSSPDSLNSPDPFSWESSSGFVPVEPSPICAEVRPQRSSKRASSNRRRRDSAIKLERIERIDADNANGWNGEQSDAAVESERAGSANDEIVPTNDLPANAGNRRRGTVGGRQTSEKCTEVERQEGPRPPRRGGRVKQTKAATPPEQTTVRSRGMKSTSSAKERPEQPPKARRTPRPRKASPAAVSPVSVATVESSPVSLSPEVSQAKSSSDLLTPQEIPNPKISTKSSVSANASRRSRRSAQSPVSPALLETTSEPSAIPSHSSSAREPFTIVRKVGKGRDKGNAKGVERIDREEGNSQRSSISIEERRLSVPSSNSVSVPGLSSGPGIATPDFSLASFVWCERNSIVRETVRNALDHPGAWSPALFCGPTGTGKTHLARGILQEYRRRWPRRTAVLMTAEQFTSEYVAAAAGGGFPGFRRRYRDCDLLILEDIQFLLDGKRSTQQELHSTVDALITAQKQVLFTSDRPIPEMSGLHAGLRTRIQGGIVCPIVEPDYATRLAILRRVYAPDSASSDAQRIRWKDSVLRQVASRVTSHVRELFGAMHRLEVSQRLSQKSLTLEQVDQILNELLQENHRSVRLADVSRAVCQTLGLEEGGLQSDSRRICFSQPRMLAMWLARRYTRAALTEIGAFFGGRRHSTVISAQKRVEGWIESGDTLSFADTPLRVEEVIRRIEESLRAS